MEAIQWKLIVYLILFTDFFHTFICLDNFFLTLKLPILVFRRSRSVLQKRSNLSWWISTFRPASPQTEGKLNLYLRFAPWSEKTYFLYFIYYYRTVLSFIKTAFYLHTILTKQLWWQDIKQQKMSDDFKFRLERNPFIVFFWWIIVSGLLLRHVSAIRVFFSTKTYS